MVLGTRPTAELPRHSTGARVFVLLRGTGLCNVSICVCASQAHVCSQGRAAGWKAKGLRQEAMEKAGDGAPLVEFFA